MPNTDPAADTGLPQSTRRTFLGGLRELAALPLIGGSGALIGKPARAAVSVTEELLDSYDEWLFHERQTLHIERFGMERHRETLRFIPVTRAMRFHFPGYPSSWETAPQPSTRAALVLSAVGCNWRCDAHD